MRGARRHGLFLWAPFLLLIGTVPEGTAACTVEPAGKGPASGLVKHLSSDCTLLEREAHAVAGDLVIKTIKQGHPVDLAGVVVQGDIVFDALPVETIQLPKGLSPEQSAALAELSAEALRRVAAPLTLRDSVVRGAVRHRSPKGTLQFEGTVDLYGTRFQGGVDLSRSVFQRAVNASSAVFEKEAYFVHSQFSQALNCAGTMFGPHTRFHRSVFRGEVACAGAVFDGMAEFLEVTFEQPVSMEGARFGSGTGFSGSRFKRHTNFSDSIFSRDTFFTFAAFESDVSFAGAQFLGHADFSDAEFKRADDLAKARFDQEPTLARAKRVVEERKSVLESPAAQYAITLFFLLMAALLVAYAFKLK